VEILGVVVSTLDMAESAATIAAWAAGSVPDGGPRYVCATSVHGLVEAHRDPHFRSILGRADLVTPDGMPLVWLGRRRGHGAMARVYGPELMKEVCRRTMSGPVRHFLYGGAPGVADQLARRLAAEFPGLQVVGTHCPPFRELTEAELLEAARTIDDSRCDIVWVGLSTPKQERWIARIRPLLHAKVLLSVGAAFDFHTGRVRQAPRWMQRNGLEWLYRLVKEPGRLGRRYAVNNPLFLALVLREEMRRMRARGRTDSAAAGPIEEAGTEPS
jgi:N-acetylglucosaminyldiphosphoundecaprenol N-acetyl-beta-D-mannosaminyltransferase